MTSLRTPRTLAVLLAVSLTGRTAAAAAAAPAAPAAQNGSVRLIYGPTGRTAGHLVVTGTRAGDREPSASLVPASGILPALAAHTPVTLVDGASGLTLFASPSFSRPVDGVLRLPLPVRVIGRVRGFDGEPAAVTLHVGSGRRVAVSDYQRSEMGLHFLPFVEENRAWGLDLPPIAERWQTSHPARDGSFDSGWIAVEGPPQLIVEDRDGRLATLEVPLPPATAPHATLTAIEVAPQAAPPVDIDRTALPATDLPLALAAGLDRAVPLAGSEATAALRLTLLHRVLPAAARFAMRRGEIPLDGGVTRIAGLPAFSALELYVSGPTPGLVVRRALAAGGTDGVRVALGAVEVLGAPRHLALTGVVRFAGGEAIAGATVVYSSYPYRTETRTDRQGRFSVPEAVAGRAAIVFVDARSASGTPPFDRVTISRRFEIPADAASFTADVEVPRPAAGGAAAIRSCPWGFPESMEPIEYRFANCGTRYTQDPLQLAFCPVLAAYRVSSGVSEISQVEIAEIRVDPDGGFAQAIIRLPQTGEYNLVLSYTPFVYALSVAVLDNLDPVLVSFTPPAPWASTTISALDRQGRPAADLDIAFPNWVEPADAYEALTSGLGTLQIDCFNLDPVPAFVADPRGCFEGPVRLRERGTNIQLGSCEEL